MLQRSGLQQRSGLALRGRLCAATIRLGHGSGASESVHRGLGKLVSSGGWAVRLRLQEASVPGGPGLLPGSFSSDTRAPRVGREAGLRSPIPVGHCTHRGHAEAPAREVPGQAGRSGSAHSARGHLSAHW